MPSWSHNPVCVGPSGTMASACLGPGPEGSDRALRTRSANNCFLRSCATAAVLCVLTGSEMGVWVMMWALPPAR